MRWIAEKELIGARLLVWGIIILYFLYLMPFIRHFSLDMAVWKALFQTEDSFVIPLLRALGFALLLFKVSLASKEAKYLSFLLLPIILGNVSIAFIFKLLLLDTSLPYQTAVSKFFSLSIIQIWQYGSLFTYLFWLNQQTISTKVWEYVGAMRLNVVEKIRDIVLPKQRNLSLLLFMLAFIFSFYEDAKIDSCGLTID